MRARSLVAAALAAGLVLATEAHAADGFDVVALGALGGIQDGNLSAYLVHPHDDDRAVTFARPRTVAMTFEPEFVALNQRLREFIVGEHGATKSAGADHA